MVLDKLSPRDVFIGVFLVGVALYWWLNRRKLNLPSGPVGLPILGYLPFLSKEAHLDFIELQKKYGDIFSLYLGTYFTIVLNEYKLVKEAFEKPEVHARPEGLFGFHPDGFGFLSNSGSEWVEQRRYTMKNLRDIGLGKSGWIDHLEAEVSDFIKIIEDNVGKPINLLEPISASVSSNITSLIFGKRMPMGDPNRKIVDKETEATSEAFLQAGFLTFFPRLSTVFAMFGYRKLSVWFKAMKKFNKFVRSEIYKRKAGIIEGHEEIFIDGYLKEIEKHKGDPNNSFTEKELVGNVQAMVVAGSETTRTSLLWLLLAMAAHGDIQEKVHNEIDLVLGKEGKCSWMERNKLPYTYGAILEAQRWRTITPTGVLHSVNEDTKIAGYDIPKSTRVVPNLWALHYDPRYWKEPEKFDPQRFLLKDGTIMTQRPESFVPFSVGRRVCPGEFVALIELLHYFTAIMQKFKIQPPKGKTVNLEGISGGTYAPIKQELLFTLRE